MTLPNGWAEVTLDTLTRDDSPICYGVLKPGDPNPGGVRMVRVTDIRRNGLDETGLVTISDRLDQEFHRSRVLPGDVLISVQGTVGRVAVVPDSLTNANISRTIARIRTVAGVQPRWLWRALLAPQFQERAGDQVAGTTRDSLNIGTLRELRLAVPPLAEQHRIVAKLDVLTARLARARAELDRVPALAQHLRQTSVTVAFAGWPREKLGDVSTSIVYGYTASAHPNGPGSKFLRITDIQAGKVNWGTVPFVSPTSKDLERCRLRSGDIVFARSGATVGKSFLVEDPPQDAVFASYLIRVRVDKGRIRPEVAAYYFQSDEYWAQIREGATGTGQPNFNGSKLAELLVPVGEPEAQQQAMAAVRSAFARADRLEAEAARARALLDRLEAAILARAFRGGLVPQDPSDEPASVHLDRIRAQRAAAPKPQRGRRKVEACVA